MCQKFWPLTYSAKCTYTKVLVEEEEIDFAAVGIGSHGEQRFNSSLLYL